MRAGGSGGRGRRFVAAGLAIAAAGISACANEGLPTWAMHVRPAPVDAQLDPRAVRAQVVRELEQPQLHQGHVPPEQIALIAVQELREGRLADAGLWLSIASYRYHEEAMLAGVAGEAGLGTLPPYVRRDGYVKLVVAEIKRFASLEFSDELDVIDARLRGRDEVEAALQEQLVGLGKTSAVDHESLRDVLAELRPKGGGADEITHYPELVDAFRRRLLEDFRRRGRDRYPAYLLARTPIAALQRDAVLASVSAFEPAACSAVALAFPEQRASMVAALDHKRPEVRANAAATLGLAPSEETRPLLEARLAAESDPRVKLALAFSLVRHGAAEHLTALTAAVGSCKPTTCGLPTALIQWLPPSTRQDLDEAPFARILADTSMEDRARRFAAAVLHDIGHQRPLGPASIEALIVAGRQKGEEMRLPEIALEAVEEATNLSRGTVVSRLGRFGTGEEHQDAMFPAPLLARLAKVSIAADLPLLKSTMLRFGERGTIEAHYIVDAALHIPGPEAADVLGDWYVRYAPLRAHIGFGLARREGFPRERLERLVARGDARTQITVKIVLRTTDARDTLLRYLVDGSAEDKFSAASLAAFIGPAGLDEPLHNLLTFHDARYYPNDALLRHAAMQSLVRLALIASRPSPAKPPPGPAGSAPRSP